MVRMEDMESALCVHVCVCVYYTYGAYMYNIYIYTYIKGGLMVRTNLPHKMHS